MDANVLFEAELYIWGFFFKVSMNLDFDDVNLIPFFEFIPSIGSQQYFFVDYSYYIRGYTYKCIPYRLK